MNGKVVVITGATSGIGQVAAERLAAMGARIVMVARDRTRADATISRLRQIAPGMAHSVHIADLSLMEEARRVGELIAAAEPHIDVLMNNAGGIFYEHKITREGLELTFATNHMAYFVLTDTLRKTLLASAPARIVNTSSEAHRRERLDFDDLQNAGNYRALTAYSQSKLCNILFTRELARQLSGTGVTANSFHPGFVDTRFADGGKGALYYGFLVAKKFALTPEQGAETMVYLASSPAVENISGEYFEKCTVKLPNAAAQDDAGARRLWEISESTSRRSPVPDSRPGR